MRGVAEAKKMKAGDGYYAEGSQLIVGMPGTFSEEVPLPAEERVGEGA